MSKPLSLLMVLLLAAGCGGSSGGSESPAPVNDAPVAADDAARTRPGVAVDVDVLVNDSDRNNDALTIELPAANASATFEVVAGRLRVTPAAGYLGTLAFTYRVRDARGAASAPATVSLNVGVHARAMVVLGTLLPSLTPPRRVIASTTAGEHRALSGAVSLPSPCVSDGSATIAADGRRLLSTRCASATRADVVLASPRATPLADPVVVHANAPIAPGLAVYGSLAEVIVAERITNPDDTSLPAVHELVRVDVATRAVVQRMSLPGIQRVAHVRRTGGGNYRVLLLADDSLGARGFYLADLVAGSVTRISEATALMPGFETSAMSPDGRFLALQWPIVSDVRGYDAQDPGALRTLWSAPGAGPLTYVTATQFAQTVSAGATIITAVVNGLTHEVALWSVPLAATANAREVVRFVAGTGGLQLLVRGDIAVYAEDAGAGGLSHVHAVRLSSGERVATLSPAGGIAVESLDRFTGNVVLLTVRDAQQRVRGALVRVAQPGVIVPVAPDHEVEPFSLTMDEAETLVGFTAMHPSTATRHAYVADVNLPGRPVPIEAGRQIGEDAIFSLILGAPDAP
jgi:hypothetical protein